MQAGGTADHFVGTARPDGNVAVQIIDAGSAGEFTRHCNRVVRVHATIRRSGAIQPRRADIDRQDDARVARRKRRCGTIGLGLADRCRRPCDIHATVGIAAGDIAFDVVAQADAETTRDVVPLLLRLDLGEFIRVVVTATRAARSACDRVGAPGAIGQVQRLILSGCDRATSERIVRIRLGRAADDGIDGRGRQRTIGGVAVEPPDRAQIERVERKRAILRGDRRIALVFAVDVEVPTGRSLVAKAGGQVGTVAAAVAMLAHATFGRAGDADELLLHDDVDDATDRVGAIGC